MLIEPNNLPSALDVERFFFTAMNAVGWASKTPRISNHPTLKGWKQVYYQGTIGSCPVYLCDEWGNRGDEGFGHTDILAFFDSDTDPVAIPLWSMQYWGKYPKHVLLRVKSRLQLAYSENKFFGGRGETSDVGDIRYYNDWYGDFRRFHGAEHVKENHASAGENNLWKDAGSHQFLGGMRI